MASEEDLKAEIERLRAENEALKKPTRGQMSLKVSEKGPDKEQKFLYIVDGSNKAIRILNRRTLETLASVGGHAGHNAREFFHIHSVAADSKGNLFLGEVNNGQRYYRYAFKGMEQVPAR